MVFGGSLTLVFSEETWEAVRGPKGLSSELGFPRGGIRVPRYLVLYRANPSVWPTDAKKALAVWEGTIAGGDHLLKTGALKEVGWFTPQEGYAIFESDSKEKVLGMVQPSSLTTTRTSARSCPGRMPRKRSWAVPVG